MSDHLRGLSLALSGGGARGFAHVGVLRFLEEKNIKVRALVGCSAGAIAGAGCALGKSTDEMRQKVLDFVESPLANQGVLRSMVDQDKGPESLGLADRLFNMYCRGKMVKSFLLDESLMEKDYFSKIIEFFLPDIDMRDTNIPFACVATDVLTGKPEILNTGSLRKAVLASCSIPGIAPVVELNGKYLVDGGVSSLVPVIEAKELYGGPVVAVNLERKIEEKKPGKGALEIYLRASDLQSVRLANLLLEQADLVLNPMVKNIHWADFLQCEVVMQKGYEAGVAAWSELSEIAYPKPLEKWFRSLFFRKK